MKTGDMRDNRSEESNIERLRRIRQESRKRDPGHSHSSARKRGADTGDPLYIGASPDDPGNGKSAVVGSFFVDVDDAAGAGNGSGAGRTAGNGRETGNVRRSSAGGRAAGTARGSGGSRAQGNGRARARQTRRKQRHPLLFLIAVLILSLAAFGFVRLRNRGTENPEAVVPEAAPEIPEKGFYTVAVFGVDSRDGELGKGALSDVNMIACLNRETGEIRIVSVYRDLFIQIDEKGKYHKFNEAYFRGGPDQALWAIKHNLDIVPDDYATFNWKAVIDAINIMGGVDIEITEPEFAYINAFITETVEATGIGSVQLKHAGMNHLDGVQAVAYARLRLMDTDFQRTERQRRVISLLAEKAKKADPKTLMELVTSVLPETKTSVTIADLLPMAANAKKFYLGSTGGFPFEKTTGKIDGRDSVIPVTLETNVIQLHRFLFDDEAYKAPESVREVSSTLVKKTGKKADSSEGVKTPVGDGDLGSGSGQASQTKPAKEPEKKQESKAETTKAETTKAETTKAESAKAESAATDDSAEAGTGKNGSASGTSETPAENGSSAETAGTREDAGSSLNASEASETVPEPSGEEKPAAGKNRQESAQSASEQSQEQINRLFGAPIERTAESEEAGPGINLFGN